MVKKMIVWLEESMKCLCKYSNSNNFICRLCASKAVEMCKVNSTTPVGLQLLLASCNQLTNLSKLCLCDI